MAAALAGHNRVTCLTWSQTEVFLFATKQHTQWTPLFSIGILLHQPVKPSVFGRVDLAPQPFSQKEDHCGPSAEEGHAELLLLVRHSSPQHYCFCPGFNYLLVYLLIEDGSYILRHWFWPAFHVICLLLRFLPLQNETYLIVLHFDPVLLSSVCWGQVVTAVAGGGSALGWKAGSYRQTPEMSIWFGWHHSNLSVAAGILSHTDSLNDSELWEKIFIPQCA